MKAIKKFLYELETISGNIERYHQKGEYWQTLEQLRKKATNDILSLDDRRRKDVIMRMEDIAPKLDKAEPLIREHHRKARNNQFSFDDFEGEVFYLFGKPEKSKINLLHYLHCWHDAIMMKRAELKIFKSDIQKVFESGPARMRDDEKLSLNEIALKYVFEGNQITREDSTSIAKEYGHNSGDKLYQRCSYWGSRANRTGRPEPCTPKKLKNKIELFEKVIKLLPKPQQKRAVEEVEILKRIYDEEYL